jgi:hypothetical protein
MISKPREAAAVTAEASPVADRVIEVLGVRQAASISLERTVSRALLRLASLVVILAVIAAGVGLFSRGGNGTETFTSERGQAVEMFGRGLYRHDSLFAGAGARGTDAVTLVLAIPFLIVATTLYRRGSGRGALLLAGALTWFLYVYASAALGTVAYNDLFLVYVALFSASLFALALALRACRTPGLLSHFASREPRRGLATFLFASGLLTLGVWLIDPISGLIRGEVPKSLAVYTTLFTTGLDIGVIVPLAFLAGWLVRQRDPLGYLIAIPLMVLEAMLAPMITAQTISQLAAGYSFTPGAIIGPICGFTLIALIAIWMLVGLMRDIPDTA